MGDIGRASFLQMAYDQYSPPEFAKVHLDCVAGVFACTMTPEEMAAEQEKIAQKLKEEGVLP